MRFSLLDLNKYLMYAFNCKYIKSIFDAKLLFIDTDSLAYEMKTKMFMDIFIETKICLILVTIHWIQSSLILLIKKLLAK